MKFTNNDLEKIKTVLNLSEKEFIGLIENNDIVKIANDYESAYKDFVDFENDYGGTNLSYEELRKLCCPSALITHDSSLVEENEAEAHRRSVRCKIKRLHKIRELRNMN